MSGEVNAAGNSGGRARESRKKVVLAFVIAASGVCLGGAAAIIAITQGASTVVSLSMMAGFVVAGVVPALFIAHRATRVTDEPAPSMLEQQLSARYGVPVRRLAFHVWDVDGELVEATFDTSTGYLTAGGRQLHL